MTQARLALKTNETPVGCVLVYKDRVIARGMNATNVTRNGTRHAELMAISALLSYSPASDLEKAAPTRMPLGDKTNMAQATEETSTWGDVDPKDGHLYPYGQKLHPSPRVDASVITECTLYVTVEPCVMCASLLRQLKVKKVFFGAVNDKFGGTGGVFRIHKNSPFSMASAPPSPAPQNGKGIARPVLERRPATTDAVAEEHNLVEEANDECNMVVSPIADTSALPGDGGNIERGYEAEGGWGRDEAVTLLRQFYVQENNRG
jgi:tRNA(Arg) A34 adenosine deaminase TadA